jgi:hypothetical protein
VKRAGHLALTIVVALPAGVAARRPPHAAPVAPAPNPYVVQPSSPYYVPGAGAYGAGPVVGDIGSPDDAVAPDELGSRERDDLALRAAVSTYLPGGDSGWGGAGAIPPQPALEFSRGHEQLEAWILRNRGIRPPDDGAVAAWAAVYRAEARKLLAAADRAGGERTSDACRALDATVRASRIPHAPRPALETGAASALTWLARAAESCVQGLQVTTALRLVHARESFAGVDGRLR